MSPSALPRELVFHLSSHLVSLDQAADAIEEHILFRRSKGDNLYDISVSLVELERRLPRLGPSIRHAQYVTNIPPPTDLTPPATTSAHAHSASPATILAHLVSKPTPSVQQMREVVLEYVITRETRLRERKYGRGGKGTLGRDGFEEIAGHINEIEEGLRGKGQLAGPRGVVLANPVASDEELDEERQIALALLLSLRMLLSYFTLADLARQLLRQTPTDAERTLVQHLRRRVAGEGRFGVGKELEYVEGLTLNRRPALRPAFHSARARAHLPQRAVYAVPLPAPGKSACLKLLTAFVRDIEQAGPGAAVSYMQRGPSYGLASDRQGNSGAFRNRKGSPRTTGGSPSSPSSPTLGGSPVKSNHLPLPSDPTPIASYAQELLSEWLMREKREYMLKNKWVKTGREQLSKDLGDIETSLCMASKGMPSKHAQSLLPTFLYLRRTFALPPSPLPRAITDTYLDMIPSLPDPDFIPLREPTVSSTTAALYVNPRLDDGSALEAVEELLETEREKGITAGVSEEKTIAWLQGLVDQVEKRFPDGSYEAVFERARHLAVHPRVWPDLDPSSVFRINRTSQLSSPSSAGHRRSKSSAVPSTLIVEDDFEPPQGIRSPSRSHNRSASLPMNSRTGQSDEVHDARPAVTASRMHADRYAPRADRPDTPESSDPSEKVYDTDADTDTDSVDSEFVRRVAPLPHLPTSLGLSASTSSIVRNKPPPTLNLVVPGPDLGFSFDVDEPQPTSATGSGSVATPQTAESSGGWWDVVSPMAANHSPQVPKPWEGGANGSSPRRSSAYSLPPGAEPAAAQVLFTSNAKPDDGTLQTSPGPAIDLSLDTVTPRITAKAITPKTTPVARHAPQFDKDVPPVPDPPADERPVTPPHPYRGQPDEFGVSLDSPEQSSESHYTVQRSSNEYIPSATATWHAKPTAPLTYAPPRSHTYGSLSGSRPPPVPTMINRPNFPAPGSAPISPVTSYPMPTSPTKPAPRDVAYSPREATFTHRESTFNHRETAFVRSDLAYSPRESTFTQQRDSAFVPPPSRESTFTQRDAAFVPPPSRESTFTQRDAPSPRSSGGYSSRSPREQSFLHREPGFSPRDSQFSRELPPVVPPRDAAPLMTPREAPLVIHTHVAHPSANHSSQPSASAVKSKMNTFGRSMGHLVMARSRGDKDSSQPPANAMRKPEPPGAVTNNPGRWNRDMVIGIMGPPAERR
ncbi:hypothetical protein VHUM_01436 [Vanrija humicola]|uniref:Uncharacterized protein n=1 Tax=Vanrija humicola TaxID=5417 RepID=A0A7D8ZC58_VANHU|nr:hypothetical protein VHUM_01436 [Vanrija humicola]